MAVSLLFPCSESGIFGKMKITKVMNASRRHFCSNQAPSSATAATATADQEKKKKEIAQSGPMDHTYFLIVTIILSK